MSDETQACETPVHDLLLNIPKDYSHTFETQWATDGTATGHHHIPIGHLAHKAATKIADLTAKLAEAEADIVDLRADLAKEFTRRVSEKLRAEKAEAELSRYKDAPVAAKPIAWRYHWIGGDEPDVWCYAETETCTPHLKVIEPLYAADALTAKDARIAELGKWLTDLSDACDGNYKELVDECHKALAANSERGVSDV